MAPFLTEVTAAPEEKEGRRGVPCVVYLLAGSRLIRLVTRNSSAVVRVSAAFVTVRTNDFLNERETQVLRDGSALRLLTST